MFYSKSPKRIIMNAAARKILKMLPLSCTIGKNVPVVIDCMSENEFGAAYRMFKESSKFKRGIDADEIGSRENFFDYLHSSVVLSVKDANQKFDPTCAVITAGFSPCCRAIKTSNGAGYVCIDQEYRNLDLGTPLMAIFAQVSYLLGFKVCVARTAFNSPSVKGMMCCVS